MNVLSVLFLRLMSKENSKPISTYIIHGDISLRAVIYHAQLTSSSSVGMVLCHPHPLYGGDMNNNVVMALYHACIAEGWPTLRFNFRGTGGSSGRFADGIGEQEDVKAACQFLQTETGVSQIIMIGYSFGAAVGCAIVDKMSSVMGYCAISYPFTFIPEFVKTAHTTKPKLFVMGTKDNFTTVSAFQEAMEQMPEPKETHLLPGIDHFWGGHERQLKEIVLDWLKRTISKL